MNIYLEHDIVICARLGAIRPAVWARELRFEKQIIGGRDGRSPDRRRRGQERTQREKSGSISLNCLNGSNGKKTDK